MTKIRHRHDNMHPRKASHSFALGAALLIAPMASGQTEEEPDVFELSPFTVDGSDNQGYRATSTLAGTRIRTSLKDVGSAISVVTEEFLRDTQATDNESLLIYTTNTEVGGINGNFAGGGDGGRVDTDSQRLRPNQSTRVRGLAAADNTRDFFVTDIPWDSYIVDRVDLQRGPNSVLFGLGSPAGVINATTHSANYEDGGDAEVRIGSYDTRRFSVDYNKVVLENQLAVRVAALNEDQRYRQEGSFEKDERYFVALKWEPSLLQGESSSTTFQAKYETGDIEANRPRIIPPIDRITPWFDQMGKATYDSATVQNGAATAGNPDFDPYIGNALGRIFDGPVAVFDNASVPTQSYYFLAAGGDGNLTPGNYLGIDSFDGYAKRANGGAGLPAANIGVHKSTTLSDPTIFDFYNKLIDGPNKSEWQKWDAYNFSLSRNMLDNRLGLEVVLDKQDYEDGQTNVLDNAGQSISIDIMSTLPNGTDVGAPNPNVGRPIIGGDARNNFRNFRDRETFRFTGYYDVDFRDVNSEMLGDIIGRHVFTGVYAKQEFTQNQRRWIRSTSSNINAASAVDQANRYVANLVYLGPSLAGASSASGANLSALQAELIPTNGVIDLATGANSPIRVWSEPAGDVGNLYTTADLARNRTDSKAFVWQGYLFGGNVVPVFGYREDSDAAANAGNVPDHPSVAGAVDPTSEDWTVPDSTQEIDLSQNKTYATASGINRTFSLVAHTPQSIREYLPAGMNVSLTYSDSENFRPDASRRDLVGDPINPTTGETTEYGLLISALNGKFNFKINRYKTKVFQDTLSANSIANTYMVGAGEGWGHQYAQLAAAGLGAYEANNYALVDPALDYDPATNPYVDPAVTDLRYQPQEGQSVADALAEQQAALGAMLDPANNTGIERFSQFLSFWNQDWEEVAARQGVDAGGFAWGGEPANFAVTGDTVSEGWEYELFYQPTDNWNIAINASKTEATRLNIAESYADFVEDRWELYQGPYGDVRIWGPGNTADTVRAKFGREFYSSYTLFRLLNGSNVAELRPWRFNMVTNYNFSDGAFSGLNVGGGLRWQDEVVVGYPVLGNAEDGYSFDIDDPYRGGSETNVDLWAGYERALTDGIRWRVQLNVRNAFSSKSLIPVTVQPDGQAATSRIQDGATWVLSNTFSF